VKRMKAENAVAFAVVAVTLCAVVSGYAAAELLKRQEPGNGLERY